MRRISLLTGMGRGLLWIAAIVLLGGCASQSPQKAPVLAENPAMSPQIEKNKEMNPSRKRPAALPPLAELKPRVASEEKMAYEGKLFSLSARNTPMRDALLGLAQEAGLNLIIEKGVEPEEPVSAEMHDMPLKTAMEVLLSSYGYFYALEGNILRIKAVETRIFNFDYTLLSNIPTSNVGGDMMGGGGSSSGGGSGVEGTYELETKIDEESLDIWKQIEEVLTPGNTPGGGRSDDSGKAGGAAKSGGGDTSGILSDLGQAQINKMAGNIIVTDRRQNLQLVEEYLNRLQLALRRQVVIEAKIVEVTLSEDHQWGIDWDMINRGIDGADISFKTAFANPASNITLGILDLTGKSTSNTLIKALDSQGSVNVLSAPRINVLNNQSALISVGQSIPYLNWQVDTQVNNNTTVTTVVPKVDKAQSGISLGVTPQIDAEGMVTLHITPVITDNTASVSFSYNGSTWTVPVLDSRTTDTIVRVRDGETVVLGGLIQERHTDDSSKIPVLGDLPVFGHILFGGESKATTKLELVIMLTPTVVEL